MVTTNNRLAWPVKETNMVQRKRIRNINGLASIRMDMAFGDAWLLCNGSPVPFVDICYVTGWLVVDGYDSGYVVTAVMRDRRGAPVAVVEPYRSSEPTLCGDVDYCDSTED